MPLFGRSSHPSSPLAGPTVEAGWDSRGEWREWEAPFSVVRGESNYLEALFRVVGGEVRPAGYLLPVAVTLKRDPSNPYDANAVRVQIGQEHVGFIARDVAADLSRDMDSFSCAEMVVAGIVRGGSTGAPNLGVHVWLHRRIGPGIEIVLTGLPTASWPPTSSEVDDVADPVGEEFPPGQIIIDLLPERVAAGLTVCFTGNSICRIGDEPLGRRDQAILALSRGLSVSDRMTKNVDVLVVSDLRSATGKAQKAREYGTSVMHEPVFWRALGMPIERTGPS